MSHGAASPGNLPAEAGTGQGEAAVTREHTRPNGVSPFARSEKLPASCRGLAGAPSRRTSLS